MLSKITDLNPASYNPREITEEAFLGLKYSLEEFGDLSCIVFNTRTKNLVAGHQRVKALTEKHGDLEIINDEIKTPSGDVFKIRLVDWDEKKEKIANITANNPHLQGEFTSGLKMLVDDIKLELPDEMVKLRIDEIEIPLSIDYNPVNKEKEIVELTTEHECPSCGYKW